MLIENIEFKLTKITYIQVTRLLLQKNKKSIKKYND